MNDVKILFNILRIRCGEPCEDVDIYLTLNFLSSWLGKGYGLEMFLEKWLWCGTTSSTIYFVFAANKANEVIGFWTEVNS